MLNFSEKYTICTYMYIYVYTYIHIHTSSIYVYTYYVEYIHILVPSIFMANPKPSVLFSNFCHPMVPGVMTISKSWRRPKVAGGAADGPGVLLIDDGHIPSGYLTLPWKWPIYRWFTY